MAKSTRLGGILIVAGTTVGGGMLALPIASASAGFGLSVVCLVSMWALMAYTALITLEMNLYFNKGVSIAYAAEYALGRVGKIVSTVTIALLFYTLLSAYMAGGASVLDQVIEYLVGVKISKTASALLFGGVLGAIILARTRVVDAFNRGLLSIKTLFFVLIVAACFPKVDVSLLTHFPDRSGSFFVALVPLFFTSFGFHGSIPTIVNYIGVDPKKLRSTFLVGSLIPLLVYILWETVVLGVIPLAGDLSFEFIKHNNGDLGVFVDTLSAVAGGGWVVMACQGFTSIAVATSFLGVGIGLFDFMEEQLSRRHKRPNSLVTGLFTFLVPFVFAVYYPEGFIVALGYAAIALSVLAVIIPTLIVWKLRPANTKSSYVVSGGTIGLIVAILSGFIIIGLELSTILSRLYNFYFHGV
jgi:tyrosine-specific transport protein